MQKTFIILAITLLSFLPIKGLTGYGVNIGLHGLYVPTIYQKLDPTLLQNEFTLSFNQSKYSFFDEIVVGSMHIFHLDMFIILALIELVARFCFFYGVYLILKYIQVSEKKSLLSLVLLSGLVTQYMVTVPISVAQGICILGLALFLNNKKNEITPILFGVSLLIHPLTAVMFLAYFYISPVIKLSSIIPFIFLYFAPHSMGPLVMDEAWRSIVAEHSGYLLHSTLNMFIHPIQSYSLTFYLLIYIIIFVSLRKYISRDILLLLSIYPLFLLVSFIGIDIFHSTFIIQLQLHRGIFLWQLFAMILLIKHYDRNIFLLAIMIPLAFMIPFIYHIKIIPIFFLLYLIDKKIGYTLPLNIPRINTIFVLCIGVFAFIYSIYPKQSAAFSELCNWIDKNTRPDQVFIAEPSDKENITLHCKRAIFFTDQGGDQVLFDRDYAIEWQKRKNAKLPDIIKNYKVDFILSQKPLDYCQAFSNGRFYVYNTSTCKK